MRSRWRARVAKDLGIPESTLYWLAQKENGGNTIENQKIQQAEMARLKRENERLQEKNAFLKKIAMYFTKESK